MIDTLRFRIPVDIPTYVAIRDKCVKFSRSSEDESVFKRDIYSKTLIVGSHRAKVRISVTNDQCIFVEFSVPKYWFGHNVLLFPLENLPLVLDDLKNRLEDEFHVILPDFSTWRIQRVDFCYAWKLNSNEDAHLALATVKPYELPRKDLVIYPTTIWHKGNTSSAKFYLKYEEFLQGDYKELIKWGDGPFAEHILTISEGVFRFEVEMRKGKLDSHYKRDIHYTDIMKPESIQCILRDYLSVIIKVSDLSLMDESKVFRLINIGSTRRQAWDLWCFWRMYSSNSSVNQKSIKLLPRATFFAKTKQLKELGVGIYDQDNKLAFSFDIPSIYEVSETQIHDE